MNSGAGRTINVADRVAATFLVCNNESMTNHKESSNMSYRAEDHTGSVVTRDGLTMDDAFRQMSNLMSWGYRITETTVPGWFLR